MSARAPLSILVYHPEQATLYARLIRAPRGRVRVHAAATLAEAKPHVEEMEVLFAWDFPTDLLPLARRLRWIQVMGAGVDHFLAAPFPPRVLLTRCAGIFGPAMAEYTIGWLLWGTQQMEALRTAQRARRWERLTLGRLGGRTLAVVGLGEAGRAIARAARGLGMRVLGLNRSGRRVPEVERVYRRPELRELLAASDYVVLALPLTPETRGILGDGELRVMRPTAWLVNVGRGALIQEPALLRALHERWIAGAVLDVFAEEPLPVEHPFWGMPNVVVTPHVAGPDDPAEIAAIFNDNLRRFLQGRALRGRVDLRRGY